jgi:hypothetical protein
MKHVWVLFLIVAFINLLIFSRTARQALRSHPTLKEGYRKLMIGYLIGLHSPWVLMGVGCIASDITIWDYFRVQDWNPFVVAWWGYVVLLWVLGFYWLFFGQGAEFLVDHRDLWGPWKYRIPSDPRWIKVWYVVCVIGSASMLGLVLNGTFLIPQPK